MSFSAQQLTRRSDLIERVEVALREIDDFGAHELRTRDLIDTLVSQHGARASFSAGAHQFALDGIRTSSTAGYSTALRRWVEKAKSFDDE